jgi:glycosyltransferase involved in cell wall biosynthesis
MRILIISQYFWPESFRINDITLGLKEKGHEVIVLTGKPNYPAGKFYEGYGLFSKPYEEWSGIQIYRVPIITRGKGGGIRLFLNYMSFAFTASIKVLLMKKNYDTALVYEPSPITVGLPAVLLRKLYGKPFHFWVQDLWPASITAASGIKNRFVIDFFDQLTRLIYHSSTSVLVQSRAFIPYIENQGIDYKKIKYLPNSTESFQRKAYTNKLHSFNIPEGFNILFAGNIGNAQSFETLLEAARILKEKGRRVNWIILGDGRMKEEVIRRVELLDLKDCFFLLGRFSLLDMPAFFASADALLLSLKRDDIFAYTIPSKLQSYLAFGKPIIASLDGEGARVIKEANAGFVSPAEDSSALAENIIIAELTDKQTMETMALNAVAYYEREFEREALLSKLEHILQGNLL